MKITNLTNEKKEVVMFFPGQGMPYLGMGNNVYNASQQIKDIWNCASEISGFDVRKLCMKGPMNMLVQTRYQQVAVTTINIATLISLRNRFLFNEIGYSGHSVGEYSALFAANVITLENLFKIINYRSLIMQDLAKVNKGVMYGVKNYSHDMLLNLIDDLKLTGLVNICCDNNDSQQVIGGDIVSIRKIINKLFEQKVEITKLAVNGAWHTELMYGGKAQLNYFLDKIELLPPKKPIVMNVSAEFVVNTNTIKDNLINQLTNTVKWRETMGVWRKHGYNDFIEVSDKKSLYIIAENYFSGEDVNIAHSNDYN